MAVSKQRATGVSQTGSRPELARQGERTTTAAIAAYAYDQIDPGPSRTERGLEIDELRESRKSVAIGRVELGSV